MNKDLIKNIVNKEFFKNNYKILIGISIVIIMMIYNMLTKTHTVRDIKSDTKRIEDINRLTEISEQMDDGTGNTDPSDGNMLVSINNKILLYERKYIHLGGLITIDRQLQLPLKTLISINNETINLSNKRLKDYYNSNTSMIKSIYNINDYDTFEEFIKSLRNFKESKAVVMAEIVKQTLNKEDDTISFELIVITDNNEKAKFNLQVSESNNPSTDLYNIYWK